MVGPLASSTHEAPELRESGEQDQRQEMSHMSIQPQLMLTDYAGNKSHLSLSRQPLVGHNVQPAIAKDSQKRPAILSAILSVPVCGEDVEVTERFTYLGSDILVSAGCETIDIWVGPGQLWIHWIMEFGNVRTGGRKFESSGPWCFQSCSMDARLGL